MDTITTTAQEVNVNEGVVAAAPKKSRGRDKTVTKKDAKAELKKAVAEAEAASVVEPVTVQEKVQQELIEGEAVEVKEAEVLTEEKSVGTSAIIDKLCALVAEGSGIAIVPVVYVGEAFGHVVPLLREHRIAIVEIDSGHYALLSFDFAYDEYGFTGNSVGYDIANRWNTPEKLEDLIQAYISEADYYLAQANDIMKLNVSDDEKGSQKAKIKAKPKKSKKAKAKKAKVKAKKDKAKKSKKAKAKTKKSKK